MSAFAGLGVFLEDEKGQSTMQGSKTVDDVF